MNFFFIRNQRNFVRTVEITVCITSTNAIRRIRTFLLGNMFEYVCNEFIYTAKLLGYD